MRGRGFVTLKVAHFKGAFYCTALPLFQEAASPLTEPLPIYAVNEVNDLVTALTYKKTLLTTVKKGGIMKKVSFNAIAAIVKEFIMDTFVKALKIQILQEFHIQDRKGIYAYTQKNMAYNSNRIEGSTLTSEQTASLFDTGTIMTDGEFMFRAKDVEEMTGHFKMFNEVLKNLDKPLTSEMIKRFHYQLKTGVFEDYANGYPIGEFKTRANQVSDIVTELPQNIPNRINALLEWYNGSKQELSDIAKFHAEYERIHPFQDGNGRTGRAIILKQCLDSNIVPVIITNDDKIEYYHSLHIAQVDNNYEKLMDFFKREQEKYYQHAKHFVIPSNEMSLTSDDDDEEFEL